MKGRISHTLPPHAERFFARKRGGETAAPQTVEKPMVLERAAFLASFGRSQRSRKMLRHKALGLCPKPRQGDDPPAPRTLSAA